MRNFLSHSLKICLFAFVALVSTKTFAQTVTASNLNCTPAQAHCTSNDLQIVSLFVDAPPCATCNSGSNVTATLKMTIHNGTKSERTAFALYGTLSTGATVNGIGGKIFVCVGPITVKSSDLLPGETAAGNQTFTVGTISFSCGQSLTMSDNILAWTDAAGTNGDRCTTFQNATQCSDVEPKCGEAGTITIRQPLNASYTTTTACTGVNQGKIRVTPVGGLPNYTVVLKKGTTTVATQNNVTTSGYEFTGLAAGTDYSAVITDATTPTGCTYTLSPITLGSTALPNAPTTTGASRCGPGTVQLSASGCTGGTLKWYASSSGGTTINQGATYTTPSLNSSTTYYVSCTNSDGCEGSRASVTATINQVPDAPSTTGDSRCGSGTVNLSASGCTGGTLKWYTSSSGGTTINTGATYSPNISSTTTYYVSCTNSDGCEGPRTAVTGTIKTIPAAPGVNVVNNCDGTSDLTATGVTGTLLWSPGGATTTSIHVTDASPTTYTVTQTVNGCTSPAGQGVTAPKSKPATPTTTYIPPNCDEATFKVLVSGVEATDVYTITGNGGTALSGVTVLDKDGNLLNGKTTPYTAPNSNDFYFANIPAGSGFEVNVTGANGCTPDNSSLPCVSPSQFTQRVNSTTEALQSQPSVKAYPNPFSDRVKFVVTSPVAGRGNLEVYNMMGQKIKTVYQGFIYSGTQTFDLSLPRQQIANLVYVLRVGDKKMSGKLLQINQ